MFKRRTVRYIPHPHWYTKIIYSTAAVFCLLIGFPLLIFMLNWLWPMVAVLMGLLLVYWLVWYLRNGRP